MFVDDKAPGEQQTKADLLSLAGFIEWLERQPSDTEYDYGNPYRCVLAQYLGGFCTGAAEIAIIGKQDSVIANHPRTFGAVLERARASR